MARTDCLTNYLIDVSNAIKSKKGDSTPIKACEFDEEIRNLNAGVTAKLGTKTITENGIYNATDDNLDGYSSIEVETSGADLSEYFTDTINSGTTGADAGYLSCLKKLPPLKNTGTSCQYMFSGYKGGSIDLSNFDTSNVTNMSSMFSNCSNLIELDLINFETSKVTTMQYMFQNSNNLVSLNLSSFNTNNVTNMESMFYNCSKLQNLDLSNFDISKIKSLYYMFNGCKALKYLDIRNFDFSNITAFSSVFGNVPANCLIIVKDDTAKAWVLDKRSDFTNVKTVAELEE